MINFTLLPLALQSPVLPLRHLLAVSWKQNQINTAFIGLPPKKMFLDIQKESKRHITVSSRNSLDFRWTSMFVCLTLISQLATRDYSEKQWSNRKRMEPYGTVPKRDEYATCLKHPAQIQLFFETSQVKLALLKRSSSMVCCWRKAWLVWPVKFCLDWWMGSCAWFGGHNVVSSHPMAKFETILPKAIFWGQDRSKRIVKQRISPKRC